MRLVWLTLALLLWAGPGGAQPLDLDAGAADLEPSFEVDDSYGDLQLDPPVPVDPPVFDDPFEPYEEPAPPLVTVPSHEIDRKVRDELESKKYRFCTDDKYRIRRSEYYLCELAGGAATRCPEFDDACKRPPVGAAFTRPDEKKEPENSKPFSIGAGSSGFAQIVFWTLVILGVIALGTAIAKNFIGRDDEVDPEDPSLRPAPDEAEIAARIPKETDVDRLLTRARASAAEGRFEEAIRDAHWALLRHLDHAGAVDLHPSRTNGDYVRSLADHPDFQTELRHVARTVERIQFGRAAPSSELFQQVLARVLPVVKRTVALVALAFLSTTTTGCSKMFGDGNDDRGGGTPGGYSVLAEILAERNAELRYRIKRVDALEENVGMVIVVTPDLSELEWDALVKWTEAGGSLVVASNPGNGSEALDGRLGLTICDGRVVLEPGYADPGWFENAKLRTLPDSVLNVGEDWSVIARCGGGPYIAERNLGLGRVLLLPSPTLLTNAAMAVADNAWVISQLIGSPGDYDLLEDDVPTVEVVDELTGSGAETPFASLSNGKLLPTLLQLVLLLVVFCLWRGVHFGRPRDAGTQSRRSFEEHVRALGEQYRKAGVSRHALGAYGAWAVDRLRTRADPGAELSLSSLAAAVARRTGRDESEVARILVEAMTARGEDSPSESKDDLRTMRELQTLLVEIGGAR